MTQDQRIQIQSRWAHNLCVEHDSKTFCVKGMGHFGEHKYLPAGTPCYRMLPFTLGRAVEREGPGYEIFQSEAVVS